MPVSDFDLGIARNGGLTHVLDKGLGPRGWEDVLETAGEHIDIVKLGWGTSYVTNNLARKLEVLREKPVVIGGTFFEAVYVKGKKVPPMTTGFSRSTSRSEEHTSELQSLTKLVCRLLLEKKK